MRIAHFFDPVFSFNLPWTQEFCDEYRKIGMEGLVFIINGVDDARRAVRALVKDGVEWVKTYPTGDAAAPDAVADTHAYTYIHADAVAQPDADDRPYANASGLRRRAWP